ALAYYAQPRATADIDLNVFVPDTDAARAVGPLRRIGVTAGEDVLVRAKVDGQVRLSWGETPVDLFFSYDAFHDAAERAVRRVPFAEHTIPILSAEHLVVCKVVFNRPRDWVDIEAMRDAGAPLDAAEVIRWVERIVGDDDARYERVVTLLTQ
ncbi:MAG: hypothetical protein ACRDH5_15270, partial [bacterium]